MATVYRPLNTALNEVRLLKICAGLPGSPIKCKLDTVPLGDYSRHSEGVYRWSDGKMFEPDWQPPASKLAEVQWVPEYEALSYTWGDATVKHSIMVNVDTMQVTKNLYEALKALRLPDEDRLLWVDALCINQNDIPERSAQVKRMRSIYQRAKQTVMWLGNSDEDTDHAIDILEKLGGTQRQIDSFPWPEPMLGWQGPCFDPAYAMSDGEEALYSEFRAHLHEISHFKFTDLDGRDWRGLDKFFKNRYWNRIWVIQEIANSQKVEIRCGSRLMAFDTLRFLPLLRNQNDPSEYSQEDAVVHERMRVLLSQAYQIINQRSMTRHPMRTLGMENVSTSFLKTIEKFRSFQSTDPRDKVYALLGLTSLDRNMPLPEPDYSKSVFEVYSETVRAIMSHTGDLGVLCLPKSFNGTVEHHLSSWVPDWTFKPSGKALRSSSYQATGQTLPKGPEFNFHTKSKDILQRNLDGKDMMLYVRGSDPPFTDGLIRRPVYQPKPPPNPEVLRLDGFIIDSIRLCGDSIPERKFEGEGGEWKQSIVEWERLLKAFRVFVRRGDQVEEVDPGFSHPKMPEFVLTLFRGLIFAHDKLPNLGDTEDLVSVYLEHYLVWTGRISAADASVPISEAVLGAIFEYPLKDNVRGWKFATTAEGRLALIPFYAEMQDKVVMLFGSDVPMLLRPIFRTKNSDGIEEIHWLQLGTAYVHGIMAGEALDILGEKKLKTETFALM